MSNRVQSIASTMLPVSDLLSPALSKVFQRMKFDEVSTVGKTDNLIIIYDNKLCHKHLNNDDQTMYIWNKLCELGRLTLSLNESVPSKVKCLNDVIFPPLFLLVVRAVMKLCGLDEHQKTVSIPSLKIKIGQLFGKISGLVMSKKIKEQNPVDRKMAKILFVFWTMNGMTK